MTQLDIKQLIFKRVVLDNLRSVDAIDPKNDKHYQIFPAEPLKNGVEITSFNGTPSRISRISSLSKKQLNFLRYEKILPEIIDSANIKDINIDFFKNNPNFIVDLKRFIVSRVNINRDNNEFSGTLHSPDGGQSYCFYAAESGVPSHPLFFSVQGQGEPMTFVCDQHKLSEDIKSALADANLPPRQANQKKRRAPDDDERSSWRQRTA